MTSEDVGESDRFFTAYTNDFGKIRIFAKSIRKENSKLRFGTGLFSLAEIEFIQGRNHKTLTDVNVVNSYNSIKKSLAASSLAQKACEDINVLIRDGEKDENVWLLLATFLEKIDSFSSNRIDFSNYCHFLWKLFSFSGYKPELEKCVFCQKPLNPEFSGFSLSEGGVVGACCRGKVESFIAVSEEIIEALKFFSRKETNFPQSKIKFLTQKKIQLIGDDYLRHLST